MAYSESQKRATVKYIKERYDEIKIRVPKGDRDKYHRIAEERGTNLSRLIIDYLESL